MRLPARRLLSCLIAATVATPAAAQQPDARPAAADATELDRVRVVGASRPLSSFPGAVDVVSGEQLRDGRRALDLAEALPRVPGITVLDRRNYAQDLQLQSRGFGARSTFGIRGLRLIVDGIPASASDGQGQAATFALDTLDRIEVLRGPLALSYGNAAGGVVAGYTELGDDPGGDASAWFGSDATRRASVRHDGVANDWRWRLGASTFATGGARPHSAAERHTAGLVAQWARDERTRVRVTAQWLDQPYTQDPLGLSRAALRAYDAGTGPGTDPVAVQFNTRKRIGNRQLGLRWESDYAAGRSAWVNGYGVARDVVQFLAIPPGAQNPASSAGGVIDLGREQLGVDAGHRWTFDRGALALGVEVGRLDEDRRGYENFVGSALGVRGRLRRDEANRVDQREAYAVGEWTPAADWSLLAGVRHARLEFESRDAYLANGDDSGALRFSRTAGSLGLARAFGRGEAFASVGRGFETPTITELAYRPDGGGGFNRDLQPARIRSGEVGWRWRGDGVRASAALYRIDGDGEIVPADSRGGRASFTNAGDTRRDGVEFGLEGDLPRGLGYALAANAVRARFTAPFAYTVFAGGAVVTRTVDAGNRIPGVPRADGYAELNWRSADAAWSGALEARFSAGLPVDDRNSDEAAGHARFNLRVAWSAGIDAGLHAFARVDNLFDRRHVGSVIVNEGNARFFEPADRRSFTIGLGWRY